MYLITTALLLLLTVPVDASENKPTHCDDSAIWADWHEKATQQTGNLDFQTLRALWIGLCTKIGNGTLAEEEADMLFEKARTTLRHKQREERQQKTEPLALELLLLAVPSFTVIIHHKGYLYADSPV